MPETVTELAVQTDTALGDFEVFLDKCVHWGVHWIDLRDGIYGKKLLDLTDQEAKRARRAMKYRSLKAYCLNGDLFCDTIDGDEADFRAKHLGPLPRLLELATVFKPMFVGLESAHTEWRGEHDDINELLDGERSWVYDAYSDAVDMIARMGFQAAINNGAEALLVHPAETLRFFDALDTPDHCVFSWDVQASWRSGLRPTPELFESFKPVLGYVHIQGGRPENDSDGPPAHQALLERTPWPVEATVRAIASSNVSPAICVQSSRGAASPQYDPVTGLAEDVAYLRRVLEGDE